MNKFYFFMFSLIFRIDYEHTAFESFLLSGIGILIFIAFGSDKQIYLQWVKISCMDSFVLLSITI